MPGEKNYKVKEVLICLSHFCTACTVCDVLFGPLLLAPTGSLYKDENINIFMYTLAQLLSDHKALLERELACLNFLSPADFA